MGNVADPRLDGALRTVAGDWLTALDATRVFTANGYRPDPWQAEVLRSTSKRVLLLAPRQSGKGQTCAALALWHALFRPGSTTIVTAPSQRQAVELLEKVRRLLRPFSSRFPLSGESALALSWRSGSRLLTLPGKPDTIRGYTPDVAIVDEASYTADELYVAVRPMLTVSGGRLVAISSAGPRRGWFFREWTEGGDEWTRIKATSLDNPRVPAEELEAQRATLGETRFAREHLSEFVDEVEDGERNPFAFAGMKDILDEAFASALAPLEDGR